MQEKGFRHLVLIGGGHTHALLLKYWCMKPSMRPNGLISLINENRDSLYSGMIPGLIAQVYKYEDINIDLQSLADRSGVSFIQAKVTGVNVTNQYVSLSNRASIPFKYLSLNVGSESKDIRVEGQLISGIKPLKNALRLIEINDEYGNNKYCPPFYILGCGAAGLEISLSLRRRWKQRRIIIYSKKPNKYTKAFKTELINARIEVIFQEPKLNKDSNALICTGGRISQWVKESGLWVNEQGRIITNTDLRALHTDNIFATGDCGVIKDYERPQSGVWAVKATQILAQNLKRLYINKPLLSWQPQKDALQLISQPSTKRDIMEAWIIWGSIIIGPNLLIWKWKERIDKNFISKFRFQMSMNDKKMDCRGCAAKLAAQPLRRALEKAGVDKLGEDPEDARIIDNYLLQSVDGFPALISDPWLNARLTTMHACSDLWACGAKVRSAQVIITLPKLKEEEQEYLLSQCLSGIRSALEEQQAELIGGHTIESRDLAPKVAATGIQIGLCINGDIRPSEHYWRKGGCQKGDILFLSRPLGVGVLFAGAMHAKTKPHHINQAISTMTRSQHSLINCLRKFEEFYPDSIHACTDITGFGLLGHLSEMLNSSRDSLTATINLSALPVLDGAIDLLMQGHESSLAPSNKRAWKELSIMNSDKARINLEASKLIKENRKLYEAFMGLIVDPQTCGPLLLCCNKNIAEQITSTTNNRLVAVGKIE